MSFYDDLLQQGLEIPYSEDTDYYKKPLTLFGKKLATLILLMIC